VISYKFLTQLKSSYFYHIGATYLAVSFSQIESIESDGDD